MTAAYDELERKLLGVNGHAPELVGDLASDIQPERVTWVWPGRLAEGKITMLDGNPGLGKSTTALDVAARISTGAPFPGSSLARAPRGVVVMSAEDGDADTTVPRLIGAGADLSRIFILRGYLDSSGAEQPAMLPSGIDLIERAVERMHAQFLMIDPLLTHFDANINAHRGQDVRRALWPLKLLLERRGCAALLLRHLTKGESKEAIMRGEGSIGIGGVSRFGLIAIKDPDDEDAVVVAPYKVNIGPAPPSMTYRFVSIANADVARIAWDADPRQWNANDLVEAASESMDALDLSESAVWLQDYLGHGPQPADACFRDAKKAGYGDTALKRAKKRLNVRSTKEGFAQEGRWCWVLPQHDTEIV